MSTAGHDAEQADAFCRRLREQLEQQPGVAAVSYADYVPLSVAAGSWEDLHRRVRAGPSENIKYLPQRHCAGVLHLLKIPMLADAISTRTTTPRTLR